MRTKNLPCYQRMDQRRVWAREHGCSGRLAKQLAARVDEFRDFVWTQGIDPDSLGPFAQRAAPGGHPRVDTPRSRAFKRVYHELRALGATSEDATLGAGSSVERSRVIRALNGSVFKQEGKP